MNDKQAVKLDEPHRRKFQQELLEIYKEFDRICRVCGLPYVMSGGTLLGAVRHKGFIPWDDDMDADMLRGDYETFCRVVDDVIDHERFFFQNAANDPGYRWVYGKLRRKNTEYIRVGQGVLTQKTGLCIDIFPLDAAYDDWRQPIANHGCRILRKFLWAPVGAHEGTSVTERLFFQALSAIPRDWSMAWHHKLAVWARTGQPKRYLISHNTGDIWGRKYERAWFEKTVEMTFEDCKFLAPQGYDGVLRVNYGDYMTLPPIEDRHGNSAAARLRFSDGEELCGDSGTI